MDTIRLFCDVARYHSFSKAAKAQGLTQSAVSQRVGSLEDRLGVRLLDRSVRPPVLTAEGEVYLKEVRSLLERYDRLEHKLSQMQTGPQGRVVIDAIYSAGIDLLKRVKDTFEAEHPRVHIEIHYKRPDEVHEAVKHGRCDLGILSYPKRWRDVGVFPLRNEAMAVVCHPQHPLAASPKVHASQLADWALVAFESSLPVGRRIKRYLRQHGVDPQFVGEFDNIDTIRNALQEVPESYAILPRRTAKRQIESGTLVAIELEPTLVRPMGVIYARHGGGVGREFTPAVQVFLDYLLERASPSSQETSEASSQPNKTPNHSPKPTISVSTVGTSGVEEGVTI